MTAQKPAARETIQIDTKNIVGDSTFRPTVIPGVSASTTNPVKPLPAGASGSVRARRKYLHVITHK